MPIPEVYCKWCAADRWCKKKPNALPNLPKHAEPECFIEPETATPMKMQIVEPGENYKLLL